MRNRQWLSHNRVGVRQDRANDFDGFVDRCQRPTGILNVQCMQTLVCYQIIMLQQTPDLVILAAEPDQKHCGKIRMAGIATDRPSQQINRFAALA
jgi:hypothetical protein